MILLSKIREALPYDRYKKQIWNTLGRPVVEHLRASAELLKDAEKLKNFLIVCVEACDNDPSLVGLLTDKSIIGVEKKLASLKASVSNLRKRFFEHLPMIAYASFS